MFKITNDFMWSVDNLGLNDYTDFKNSINSNTKLIEFNWDNHIIKIDINKNQLEFNDNIFKLNNINYNDINFKRTILSEFGKQSVTKNFTLMIGSKFWIFNQNNGILNYEKGKESVNT